MDRLRDLQKQVVALTEDIGKLKSKLFLEDIILNSTFKLLSFYGSADGTNLTRGFPIDWVRNHNILIKGIQFVPYYSGDAIDIQFSGGETETVPTSFRINRVFDASSGGGIFLGAHSVNLLINGAPEILSIAPTYDPACVPPDFEINNIYSLHKNIQDIDVNMTQEVLEDFTAPGTTQAPNIKVFIECYVF